MLPVVQGMKEIDKPNVDKPSVDKPHDKFFREVFSQADSVRELLLATLPSEPDGRLAGPEENHRREHEHDRNGRREKV